MKKLGINFQVHYIPIHLQPLYKNNYSFHKSNFPIAESFYYNEVSIPIYPALEIDEQNYCIEKIIQNLN